MKQILPNDIDMRGQVPMGTLGHYEDEVSACWLIKMAQINNTWDDFEYKDIEAVYSANGKFKNYKFNHLISHGWIEEYDNMYHFTYRFVGAFKEYYKNV